MEVSPIVHIRGVRIYNKVEKSHILWELVNHIQMPIQHAYGTGDGHLCVCAWLVLDHQQPQWWLQGATWFDRSLFDCLGFWIHLKTKYFFSKMTEGISWNLGLFQLLTQPNFIAYPYWSVVHLFDTAPKVRSGYKVWNFGEWPVELLLNGNMYNHHWLLKCSWGIYARQEPSHYWAGIGLNTWRDYCIIRYRLWARGVHHPPLPFPTKLCF